MYINNMYVHNSIQKYARVVVSLFVLELLVVILDSRYSDFDFSEFLYLASALHFLI